MIRTSSRFARAVVVAALAAALSAGPAAADAPEDPTARAEWLSSQAEVAFSEERYADAIRLYLDAWEAAPAASMLYNVAFIYDRRLNDPELAINYYDRAAASPDADPDLKSKARARIAALKADGDKLPDPPPFEPPPPPPPGETNFGPWVVAASGGGLLVGGVVMAFVASGTQSDFESARSVSEKRSLQDQGRTEALIADLLMGTGIAAIGAGVIWMIVDAGAEPARTGVAPVSSAPSALHVEPRVIPGGAALVVGGTL